MSSNFRVRPFLEEISTLRNVMRTMLLNTLQMGEHFVKCHVEWHLFTSWMENAFTNVMRTLDRKVSEIYFQQYNTDLSVDQVVGLIIKDEMLEKIIKVLVSQSLETSDLNKFRKDLGRSRVCLTKSLQESQKNNLTEALDYVTKALILAPFPADGVDHQSKSQLSFCLITRAHLLRKMGHYQACELDLYESLQHSVESNDKVSYLEKKIAEEVAVLAATKSCHPAPSNPQTIIRKFFNMDAVNDRVHGAAQYINLSYNETVGRTLITKKKVKPQVSIIAEEPYCSWLAPFLYHKYCSFCMSALEEHIFPCRKCTLVRYCSSHCEEESWESYHSVECKYMAILRNLGAGHFALRCIITAGLDKSLSILRASLNNNVANQNQTKPCKSFHNNYHDIFTLMARENEIAVMPKMAFLATFLAYLGRSMNLIDESSIHYLAALVYRQLGIGYLNSFFISDHGFGRLEREPNDSRSNDIKEIGMGLYATASLLSHSCDPNCEKLFVSNKILIVAKRALKEGEEITISYGPLKEAHSYTQRQEMLETTHSFKCVCDACSQRK